jgi:hypothetical protein
MTWFRHTHQSALVAGTGGTHKNNGMTSKLGLGERGLTTIFGTIDILLYEGPLSNKLTQAKLGSFLKRIV